LLNFLEEIYSKDTFIYFNAHPFLFFLLWFYNKILILDAPNIKKNTFIEICCNPICK